MAIDLHKIIDEECEKAFAAVYAKYKAKGVTPPKAVSLKPVSKAKPKFVDLKPVSKSKVTVEAFAGEYWAEWNAKRAKITGFIPAGFGEYGGPIAQGKGYQDAVHALGKDYVLKIQHFFEKQKANAYIEKLEAIKTHKFDHVVPVHACGHFASIPGHFYTYEVLTKLDRCVGGWGGGAVADKLHKAGINHRDGHGGNWMFDKAGKVYAIDLESLGIKEALALKDPAYAARVAKEKAEKEAARAWPDIDTVRRAVAKK